MRSGLEIDDPANPVPGDERTIDDDVNDRISIDAGECPFAARVLVRR